MAVAYVLVFWEGEKDIGSGFMREEDEEEGLEKSRYHNLSVAH